MKYLYILGATGSIGTQTLDIVRKQPNDFKVVGMSVGGSDLELSYKLIEEFKPEIVCFRKKEHMRDYSYGPILVYGDEGLNSISEYSKYENEWLVNSLVGVSGLLPTVKAIEANKNIALANKETLVVGGDIVNELIKKHNVKLLPIDSEHSAILECLTGENPKQINKLIITASGGSFRNLSRDEIENVSVEDALNHPNWKMGPKITIDSATMMNKGFEVIEACYLFNVGLDKIEVLLHPESIVHSMVEFNDGSIKAELGKTDMHRPIAYALNYPNHVKYENDFSLIGVSLNFKEMSLDRFPCLGYAIEAYKKGGLYLAALNASNEAAVYLFLNKKITFLEIEKIIYREINSSLYERDYTPSLEERLRISKEIYEKILLEFGAIL
jgi:1-deoxy-D-xylulose-5-phosphate reductoisomerase